ncbi:DUF2069 domain-containing protein [Larsenimonas salina]|uniref:DUF2069 domain-containing protein n=1 Tax=Larsenimonas salina TaxID=1295565 RepID=UPI0020740D1A|nr:DUF2069 domain-containing protein [Larsenimonas salina]MCM5703498.1 DUF2069 domain-containing protein [Larsenimonas salina]
MNTMKSCILSYVALLAVAVANAIWLVATHQMEIAPLAIRLLPLVLLGTVFWMPRTRGFIWLAFVSIIYGVQSALMIEADGQWPWSVVEILAALALLITSVNQAQRLKSKQNVANEQA